MSFITRRVFCSSTVSARRILQWSLKRNYYVRPKKKDSKGSWQAMAVLGTVTATISGVGIYMLGKPEEQILGLEMEPDKYAEKNFIVAYLLRAKDQVVGIRKMFTEPSSKLLLPDPLPFPYRKPYTLVIELKDLLLHSEYDRQTGWKYQKRPKLEYFLNSLVDYYEIVIFTSENGFSAHPLIEKLDPDHFIIYRLYRDSTKYERGHHIKDLSNLNRSLNRVIIIDTDFVAVRNQPENSIILDKWAGETTDPTLVDLSSFLLNIAANKVTDVREVLDYYKSFEGKSVLEVFKDNQQKLRSEIEAIEAMKQSSNVQSKKPGSISVFSLGHASKQYNTTTTINSTEKTETQSAIITDPSSDSSSVVQWIGSWIGWK